GLQNSRGFRALKVWLGLRQAGLEGYRRMIARDVRLASEMFRALDAHPEIEARTVALSIVTFRYVPPEMRGRGAEAREYLNRLNAQLLDRLQRGGEAFVSNAILQEDFVLRACIVNFRTQLEDVRALPEIVVRLGRRLDSQLRPRKVQRVALAYSGGLDTSIIIPWLRESYGCEVVAMIGDVGQGDDYEGLRKKALATGASQVYVEDLREEFIAGYLWKALQAGAVYEGKYLLGTSLARPALAKRQVQVALATGADALAHGCTGKGNDQVRFELAYKALAPHLAVIAPWREWNIKSREDAMGYARRHNVPVPATRKDPYSRDQNIWHLSHEGGVLETKLGE